MEYFVHKFRATIGKNKILEKDENVLFAYSSSSASVAMLNLIHKVNISLLNIRNFALFKDHLFNFLVTGFFKKKLENVCN